MIWQLFIWMKRQQRAPHRSMTQIKSRFHTGKPRWGICSPSQTSLLFPPWSHLWARHRAEWRFTCNILLGLFFSSWKTDGLVFMCQHSYVEIAISDAKCHILIVPKIDFTVQLTHHVVIWKGARGLITDNTYRLHWASFHQVLANKAFSPIILVRKGDSASLSSFTCSWVSSQHKIKGMK